MSWSSPAWLMRVWRAMYNGRTDARRMIPDQNDLRYPPYLHYLCGLGNGWAQRLSVRWERTDLPLRVRYQHAAAIYAQLRGDLSRAEQQQYALAQQFQSRKTQANKDAWRKAGTATEAVRERCKRARQELVRAIELRRAEHDKYRAVWRTLHADVLKLMSVYVTANVRYREGNAPPPALHEDAWPQLRCPEQLAELQWDPSLEDALAGRARGEEGPEPKEVTIHA